MADVAKTAGEDGREDGNGTVTPSWWKWTATKKPNKPSSLLKNPHRRPL